MSIRISNDQSPLEIQGFQGSSSPKQTSTSEKLQDLKTTAIQQQQKPEAAKASASFTQKALANLSVGTGVVLMGAGAAAGILLAPIALPGGVLIGSLGIAAGKIAKDANLIKNENKAVMVAVIFGTLATAGMVALGAKLTTMGLEKKAEFAAQKTEARRATTEPKLDETAEKELDELFEILNDSSNSKTRSKLDETTEKNLGELFEILYSNDSRPQSEKGLLSLNGDELLDNVVDFEDVSNDESSIDNFNPSAVDDSIVDAMVKNDANFDGVGKASIPRGGELKRKPVSELSEAEHAKINQGYEKREMTLMDITLKSKKEYAQFAAFFSFVNQLELLQNDSPEKESLNKALQMVHEGSQNLVNAYMDAMRPGGITMENKKLNINIAAAPLSKLAKQRARIGKQLEALLLAKNNPETNELKKHLSTIDNSFRLAGSKQAPTEVEVVAAYQAIKNHLSRGD